MEKEINKRIKNNSYMYLKHFDNIFQTNTLRYIKELPLLQKIWEHFADKLYEPNEEYKRINKEFVDISQKLEHTFTQEQKELFEEYENIYNEMINEEEKQFFIFGYTLATELQREGRDGFKPKRKYTPKTRGYTRKP